MKLLTVNDVEIIHMMIVDASGGSHWVRDRERLCGIVEQLEQSVFGVDLCPTIFFKSAALMFGIINYHPLVDGNKRTGMICALELLNLNGIDTKNFQDQEIEDYAVKVAVDNLDVKDIANWLKIHCK